MLWRIESQSSRGVAAGEALTDNHPPQVPPKRLPVCRGGREGDGGGVGAWLAHLSRRLAGSPGVMWETSGRQAAISRPVKR